MHYIEFITYKKATYCQLTRKAWKLPRAFQTLGSYFDLGTNTEQAGARIRKQMLSYSKDFEDYLLPGCWAESLEGGEKIKKMTDTKC